MKKAFETQRLILRPLTLDDAEDFDRIVDRDPKHAGQVSLEERTDRIHAYLMNDKLEPGLGWWAVTLQADGSFIGRCGIDSYLTDFLRFEDDPDNPYHSIEVELAYHIGVDYRRQGYAFEACQPLIEHAFGELRLRRIVSVTSQTNIPSQNLMRKLGFRIERNLHPEWSHEMIGILENTLISAEGFNDKENSIR